MRSDAGACEVCDDCCVAGEIAGLVRGVEADPALGERGGVALPVGARWWWLRGWARAGGGGGGGCVAAGEVGC